MKLKEAQRKMNPFVAKVNEQSLAKATAYRQKQNARAAAANTSALEFEALVEEEFDEAADGAGQMDVNGSGLDMLGEDDNAKDDIEAKMDLELV